MSSIAPSKRCDNKPSRVCQRSAAVLGTVVSGGIGFMFIALSSG
jgi:hypothetical protein